MRYSFQLLNNSLPESVAAGDFSSEQEMKAQALNYLLELARDEARVLPCCLSLVFGRKGGLAGLFDHRCPGELSGEVAGER